MKRTIWPWLLTTALLPSPASAANGRDGERALIAAEVAAASKLWARSCPRHGAEGLCAKRPARRQPARICGVKPAGVLSVRVTRRRDLARRAVALFRHALERTYVGRQKRRPALAEALLRLGDEAFERFIGLAFPRRLDFSRDNPDRVQHQRRFMTYLSRKAKLLVEARARYMKAIQQGYNPRWRAVGATRIGQIYLRFAQDLAYAPLPTPPVPRALRGKRRLRRAFVRAFEDAYCAEITDKARPLARKAGEAAAICTQSPAKGQSLEPWVTQCKRLQADVRALSTWLDAANRAHGGERRRARD